MLKKATIVLVLTFSLLGLLPQRIVSQELKITEQSLDIQIDHFANLYGVDGSIVKKVVKCESNGKQGAVGDGGRALGVMQYHEATFKRHSKLMGEELDYYSSHDQIKLGTWAIANGMGREWTAYRAIENGGKYSFYSGLMKRHYVVYCK